MRLSAPFLAFFARSAAFNFSDDDENGLLSRPSKPNYLQLSAQLTHAVRQVTVPRQESLERPQCELSLPPEFPPHSLRSLSWQLWSPTRKPTRLLQPSMAPTATALTTALLYRAQMEIFTALPQLEGISPPVVLTDRASTVALSSSSRLGAVLQPSIPSAL